jgi:hypothetical protein
MRRSTGVLELHGTVRSHTVIIRATFPSPGTKAPLSVETTCKISLLDQCVASWNPKPESNCSDGQTEDRSRTLTVPAASLRRVFSIPLRSGIPDGACGVLMDRDGGRVGVVCVLGEDHAQGGAKDQQEECTEAGSEEQDLIPVRLTVCIRPLSDPCIQNRPKVWCKFEISGTSAHCFA